MAFRRASDKQESRSLRKDSRQPRQVLIVDDEESLAYFLQQGLLEVDASWQIDTASTGEEALIKINRYAYRLIIADLRMPGLNGLELLQMVRVLEPETRVILMTAYGSAQVEAEARRLGAYRYVNKPFRIADMQQWVREALTQAAGPAHAAPPPTEEPPPAAKPLPEPSSPPPEMREKASTQIATLRFRLGAQAVFLADLKGNSLVENGHIEGVDLAGLARLLGQGWQALSSSDALPKGEAVSYSLAQKGPGYALYSVNVGNAGVLGLLYGQASQTRRQESVLQQLADAAEQLAALMTESPSEPFHEKPATLDLDQPTKETEAPSAAVSESEPIETPEGRAEHEVLSFEQARARGLISDDLLSKIEGS